MPLLPRIASLWRNLVHARRVERDLHDELHSVFDLLVDEPKRAATPDERAHLRRRLVSLFRPRRSLGRPRGRAAKRFAKVLEVESQTLTAYARPEGGTEASELTLKPEPREGDAPGKTSRFTGTLRGNSGSGTYTGKCTGTFTASRN